MRLRLFMGVPLFALPLVVLLPRAGGSATIHVPQDEPTVRSGLASAVPGDTVLVDCGTYVEHDIELAPGVVLRSATGGPDCVVIDAQGNGRVLFGISLPTGTAVEGLTLRGGHNPDGLDSRQERLPVPEDPREVVVPAERDWGGGGAGYLILSHVAFRDCVFDSNTASVHAGGIRCEGGAPVFERCEFRGNEAGARGGAVYFGAGTRPLVSECLLLGNTADYGAGIYAARPDQLTSTGTRFEGNNARFDGGGLHSSVCDPVIAGCSFVANSAGHRGGGLFVFNGTVTITGTTIALNDAPLGAGIGIDSGVADLSETIVALHTGGSTVDCVSATVQLSCSDVWGNSGGDYVDCLAGQDGVVGNYSADPLFCSWPARELGLRPASPCLPAFNSCGVLIGSTQVQACGNAAPVLLDTSPSGLTVQFDGHHLPTPVTVDCVPGAAYTVGAATPQLPAPDERYTFASWSDGGAIIHTVTAPDAGDTLIASFDEEYMLTTTASAGGGVSPWIPAFHPAGYTKSVVAVPDTGYGFVAWTGTGAGSYNGPGNPAAVTIDGPVTQHAQFELLPSVVTMVARSGGSVTPAPGDHTYAVGTTVPITAAADPGWVFAGWTGVGGGSYTGFADSTAITALGDITQTALFVQGSFTLTMAVTGTGTGTLSPPAGTHTYAAGTVVPISASPDSPYEIFGGWTGYGLGSHTGSKPAQVTMLSNIMQVAIFVPESLPNCDLTMVADSGGTVAPPSGSYLGGSTVTISAAPDFGFVFDGWTGVGLGSYTGFDNPAQILLDAYQMTQTAHFVALPRYTLTAEADPGGTVWPPTADHPEGVTVTLTATADPGYAFTGWTGTGSGSYTGSINPASVTVNGPITQTARFALLMPLTMIADPGGVVTPSSGSHTQGSIVTIEAIPDPGHLFTGWTGVGSGSFTGAVNPATVTMDGAITQTAHFSVPDSFPLTMNVSPPGAGTVTPGSGTFANGDSVVIGASPAPNHKFLGWLGSGTGSYMGPKQTATIAMQDSIAQTAYFQELPKYTLTMVPGPGGTVTPATTQYYTGTQVTITAIPDSGNGFVRWSGSGIGSYSGPDSSVTLTIAANITETASFEYDVPVTIVTSPPGLRIGADGTDYVSPQTFLWRNTSVHGVDVDSLASGAVGERHRFGSWADGAATAARTIDVPDTGVTYTASYSPERLLDFEDPAGGSGIPGDSWHPVGATVQIEAVPNPGYVFSAWTGQGSGSYTGPDNPASVTMNQPLIQAPSFDSYGYEFSISASSTDPFVNARPATGGASALYLWMTCTDVGIAAFEADVSSTMPYSSFNPAPGVLNAGGSSNLFLAIAGCPGTEGPYLIGTLNIADTGGEVCLVPSAANGRMGAVSCVMPAFLVDPVRLTGFSSSGQAPCFVPGTPCLLPAPQDGGPGPAQASPPAVAAAPVFPDAFLGVYPNPLQGRATLYFSTAAAGPVRVAVHDVTGRLVRLIVDDTLGAGEHRPEWDGRSSGGLRVPAGVYFVRLQVRQLDETRKVVLLDSGR